MNENLTYLGLDNQARALLLEHRDYLFDLLPDVIDHFYDHVSTFPEIAKYFASLPSFEHGKALQLGHWRVMLDLRFDDAYLQAAARVGHAHYRIGLPAKYYLGSSAYILNRLTGAIAETYVTAHPTRDLKTGLRLVQALQLLMALDSEVALTAYVEDGNSIYL